MLVILVKDSTSSLSQVFRHIDDILSMPDDGFDFFDLIICCISELKYNILVAGFVSYVSTVDE